MVGAGTWSRNCHIHHAPFQTGHSLRAGTSVSASQCQHRAWHGAGQWERVQEEARLGQLNGHSWSLPTPCPLCPRFRTQSSLSVSCSPWLHQSHLGGFRSNGAQAPRASESESLSMSPAICILNLTRVMLLPREGGGLLP